MEPDTDHPTFEDVYPHYEFAPLVWLALKAAAWMKGRLEKRPQAMPSVDGTRPLLR